MKISELLTEAPQKMAFTVSFRLARFKREQKFTEKTIKNLKVLTPAERTRVLKLAVDGTLQTSFTNDHGRTMVVVTRTA